MGDLPLVAHNAAFDVGVIRDACDASGLPWPDLRYACSLVLARQTYDLLSYSLPWVAEAAGSPLDHHHDPGGRRRGLRRIVLDLARRRGAASLPDLVTASHCSWDTSAATAGRAATAPGRARASCPRRTRTPTLAPLLRARDGVHRGPRLDVAGAGVADDRRARGDPGRRRDRHTSILVIGFQDARKLRPGEALSAKARKAADLRAKGQAIEVMPEEHFFQLLAL